MTDFANRMTRRRLLLALAAAGGAMALRPSSAAAALPGAGLRKPKVVVELFTSQGCNACPPADALMEDLCQARGVLGISYNIDAWDYLGWRDTLARPEFTRRQRMYAKARGDDAIYTPQMVINGHRHVVGNARDKVLAVIAEEEAAGGCQKVPLNMRRVADVLEIHIGESDAFSDREATLWLVSMREKERVKIRRGENRGREVVYHHVARRIVPAGMWHGGAMRLSLPRAEIMAGNADLCAAILQLDTHGPIIAAAEI